MTLGMHFSAANLLRRTTGELLEKGQLDAGDVVLIWDATPPTDANDADAAPAETVMTQTVRAFIHYVSANAVGRMGMEFSAGDAILTFDGAADLTGKAGLRYRLPGGRIYAQQNTARGLEEIVESMGGQRMHSTIMVRARPDAVARAPIAGEIRYRSGAGNVQLFSQDSAGLYATGRSDAARLDFSVPGEVSAWFGSRRVLRAEEDGVHVITATAVLSSALPRIEFWYGGVLRATLTSAGELAGNFSDVRPELAMRIQNGMDLFSVGEVFYPAMILLDGELRDTGPLDTVGLDEAADTAPLILTT